MDITFANQAIKLLPSGALLFPHQQVLVIADLHLGKMLALQDMGIPGHAFADLPTMQKLFQDISSFQPKKLLLLGDVFHQKSRNMQQLVKWFFEILAPLVPKIVVTLGNHDKGLFKADFKPNILVVESYKWVGIIFVHEPVEDVFCMAGHIHPGIKIKKGKLGQVYKAFLIHKKQLILPAYGVHTGVNPLKYPYQHAFIIKDKKINLYFPFSNCL